MFFRSSKGKQRWRTGLWRSTCAKVCQGLACHQPVPAPGWLRGFSKCPREHWGCQEEEFEELGWVIGHRGSELFLQIPSCSFSLSVLLSSKLARESFFLSSSEERLILLNASLQGSNPVDLWFCLDFKALLIHNKFIYLNLFLSSFFEVQNKQMLCLLWTAMGICKICDYPNLGLSVEVFYKCDCQMDVWRSVNT